MRDPADAAFRRGGEQRLGRRAGARCAVLPEDSQPGGPVTAAGVVNVPRAPIALGKIGLGYHPPSLMASARAVRARKGLAVIGSPRSLRRSLVAAPD